MFALNKIFYYDQQVKATKRKGSIRAYLRGGSQSLWHDNLLTIYALQSREIHYHQFFWGNGVIYKEENSTKLSEVIYSSWFFVEMGGGGG